LIIFASLINKVISTKRYQAFAESVFEFISAGIIKVLRSREARQQKNNDEF